MKKPISIPTKRRAIVKSKITKKAAKRIVKKSALKRKASATASARAYVGRYVIALDALSAIKRDEIDAIRVNTDRILVR